MSAAALLDINVLMALAWDNHPQFQAAEQWFLAQARPWASCPLTELGFLRLSSNPRIIKTAGSPELAHAALRRLRQLPGHQFWVNNFSPADEPLFAELKGHQQITDACLLLLARRHKGQLASFDAGMKALAQEWLGDEQRVLLIPH